MIVPLVLPMGDAADTASIARFRAAQRLRRARIIESATEALTASAIMAPVELALLIGASPAEIVATLGSDARFARVAGTGCWWWTLSQRPRTALERRAHNTQVAAAHRVVQDEITARHRACEERETRIVQALMAHDGGVIVNRVAELTGLLPAVTEACLRDLLRARRVRTFRYDSMPDLPFWKLITP